jgi:hypothetical protein
VTTQTAEATLARIRAALSSSSREATIHDVKRAVIDEFERIDRRVSIKSTEYFRHTYVPDLVLTWQDDVDRAERWVFLRSKVAPDYLLADVAVVARDQPIIFGLLTTDPTIVEEPSPDNDSRLAAGAEHLRERSSETGTLITDPLGLDALTSPVGEVAAASQIPDLVSRQIIRGGRGVYDQRTSTETTATINAGFAAAFTTGAEATFKAAISIKEHLGPRSGERLLRLLHGIWVGSGGRSDQFPDAPALGSLSDDAIELLIAGDDIDDEDFWRRLGNFDLSQLGRLNLPDRPANLGHLLAVSADKIQGRWCRVRPDQPRTGADGALQWGVEHGLLALHGSTFTAYLAEEKSELSGIEPIAQPGIAVDNLQVRAERADAAISNFTAAAGGLIIGVASETHSDVLENPQTSGSVGAAAGNITKATATLKNHHNIVCDFSAATASSRTRATLSVRELVRHGLPLVWDLHEGEMARLAEMLTPVTVLPSNEDENQISLFELVVDDETSQDVDRDLED